jgi:hypothetical protein
VLSTGTTALAMAPSPSRSRKRFGRRKAITNAWASTSVPKSRAMMRSRISPSTRLSAVASEMTLVDRAMRPIAEPLIVGDSQRLSFS